MKIYETIKYFKKTFKENFEKLQTKLIIKIIPRNKSKCNLQIDEILENLNKLCEIQNNNLKSGENFQNSKGKT